MADVQYNIDYLCRVFKDIANNIVIKYSGYAEDDETFESRTAGDLLIAATNKKDNFFMYDNYTKNDFHKAGYHEDAVIDRCLLTGDFKEIPKYYQERVLEYGRKRYIESYDEENDYYRELNGLPNYDEPESEYMFVDEYIMNAYGIAVNIPIHKIREVYNNQTPGLGDRYIYTLEASDWYKELLEEYPDKGYLKHVGVKKIPFAHARKNKNFSILFINSSNIDTNFLEEFVRIYEQCRDYYVKTIYNFHYRGIIDYYDNFIGMCILLMTFQQIAMKIPETYINRNFFNINDIRDFYELYGVPYDLSIPKQTQRNIIRNLNLLMSSKGTDKVVFDIIGLLGFTDITVNKYYLVKDRKVDPLGIPIVKKKDHFNTNTGRVDSVYDNEAMYDLYFYKMDVRNSDISNGFKDASNKVPYKDIVTQDPYWFDDANVYDRIWDTQYNYVESKYLSLGVSYSITEMMMDNSVLFKLLLEKSYNDQTLGTSLPQLTGSANIPLFDIVCMLICLTASQHNLNAEILSLPSKVIALQDYIDNSEHNTNLDTLKFNYKYFIDHPELGAKMDEFMKSNNIDEFTHKEFMFNFKDIDTAENKLIYAKLKNIMTPYDYAAFMKYITVLSRDNIEPSQRVKYINILYTNIKEIHRLIAYYMNNVVNDKDTYMMLKRLYDSLFNAKIMSEMFTITGKTTGTKRVAYNYYEYLYNMNPLLYGSVYKVDLAAEYDEYCTKTNKDHSYYKFNDFLTDIENGKVYVNYNQLKDKFEDANERRAAIAGYASHIILRLKAMFSDLPMASLLKKDSNIENLLLKMLRYFKSYTIDILNLNTIFKMDYKTYNIIKLMDVLQITHIDMDIRESFSMAYSDFVKKIIATYNSIDKKRNQIEFGDELTLDGLLNLAFPKENNKILLKDMFTQVILSYAIRDGFTNIHEIIKNINIKDSKIKDAYKMRDEISMDIIRDISNKDLNKIVFKDNIKDIAKGIQPFSDNETTISLIDVIRIYRTIKQNDEFKLKDRVVKLNKK